jgi:hypothetical protein
MEFLTCYKHINPTFLHRNNKKTPSQVTLVRSLVNLFEINPLCTSRSGRFHPCLYVRMYVRRSATFLGASALRKSGQRSELSERRLSG